MKPTLHESLRRRAYLILPFLLLPLLFAPPPGTIDAAAQQTSPSGQALPNDVGTQKLTITVIGAQNNFITGLTKEDFSVREGKTEREITYFSGDEMPASIAVLIDGSGSMHGRILSAARYATANFLTQGHPANEYLIGEFSYGWRGLSGWVQGAQARSETANKLRTEAVISPKSKARGQTALYDACDAALDALVKRSNPRRVLLLVTDGQDNQSRISFEQIRKKIKALDVQVYCIGVNERGNSTSYDLAGQAILDELAAVSGGRAYFPETPKEMDEVFERAALQLRYQYVIGFTPTNAAPDGKWNKIKIKLAPGNTNRKGYSVRSREGYFSPPAP